MYSYRLQNTKGYNVEETSVHISRELGKWDHLCNGEACSACAEGVGRMWNIKKCALEMAVMKWRQM